MIVSINYLERCRLSRKSVLNNCRHRRRGRRRHRRRRS